VKETLRHKEAFEYYYSLGDKRSYPQVSDKFTVSQTSIKKWASNFSWQERIIQRDIEIAKSLEKKTNRTIVNEKANYRKIIKVIIGKFVETIQTKIRDKQDLDIIKDLADLEKLIKLDLLLMGEATGREESVIQERTFSNERIKAAHEALYGKEE
jgi:hypothetical protein